MAAEAYRRERTHKVLFLKGDNAVVPDEADRVIVTSVGGGSELLELRWPAQKGKLATVEALLQQAEALGGERARSEIRDALGVENCRCEEAR